MHTHTPTILDENLILSFDIIGATSATPPTWEISIAMISTTMISQKTLFGVHAQVSYIKLLSSGAGGTICPMLGEPPGKVLGEPIGRVTRRHSLIQRVRTPKASLVREYIYIQVYQSFGF
jgi:hypothetical protein